MNHIKLDNYSINYQVFFKKIKHMYLRYEDDTIKITCNRKISYNMIEQFIIKHKRWVLNHHTIEKHDLYSCEYMYIWGERYPVIIDEGIKEYIVFNQDSIMIRENVFNIKKIELFFKKLIIEEINSIIRDKKNYIEQYISLDGVIYKSQLMKTRLGSCIANKRIIKLNSLLARFDKQYIKLVLYHELTHLRVSNHSNAFHSLLENLISNHKIINKNLKSEIKKFVY